MWAFVIYQYSHILGLSFFSIGTQNSGIVERICSVGLPCLLCVLYICTECVFKDRLFRVYMQAGLSLISFFLQKFNVVIVQRKNVEASDERGFHVLYEKG